MRILESMLNDPYWQSEGLKRVEQEAEIFLIDNVAEYLYAQTDQEVWDVKHDFPCLAPPFPVFWMEYARPSKIVSCEKGVTSAQYMPHRTGLLFEYTELEEKNMKTSAQFAEDLNELRQMLEKEFTPAIDAELKEAVQAGADFMDLKDERWGKVSLEARLALAHMVQYGFTEKMIKGGMGSMLSSIASKGVYWIARCHSFAQLTRNSRVVGPLCEQNLLLSRDGDVIEESFSWNPSILGRDGDYASGVSTVWFPALLAISFCHCRNVVMKTETTPEKLRKRQAERGRQHIVSSYKLLEIQPMKVILKSAGAEHPETGLRKAMHICRGHFAHYEDKGLFGKYKGRFWIPQHVRGSVEQGISLKDYVVNPGRRGR